MGNAAKETLRINGTNKNKDIFILIDGDSTHNFIQDRIVKFLGLQISQSPCFQVMVGNRDKLQYTSICSKVLVTLANTQFHIDFFFVLPISGTDSVLDIQWLQTLGPILTNYARLTMQFWLASKIT